MTDDLTRVRDILARQSNIRQALVFGSTASGTARMESDLDIAVETGRPMSMAERIELIEALAAVSGRPIDLIDLRTVGEPLLGQILSHGRRLIGNNTDYAALIRRHLFDAEDFLPYAERMVRERRQAWIG
ncbi:MAG: nucleotidyltransferase domain-containing protein [Proteobacteria bacterium]|nr:nucleotidyltransferase domain-containing protein [Pseudomonadota bacterium]